MPADRPNEYDVATLPHPVEALHEGDPQTALHAYAAREMFDYQRYGRAHSDVWICGFGTCLWLLGHSEGAARIWKQATTDALKGRFGYSSSGSYSPGLLLWFAGAILADECLREHAEALFYKLRSKKQRPIGGDEASLYAKLLRGEEDFYGIMRIYKENHPYAGNSLPSAHIAFQRQLSFYAGVKAVTLEQPQEAERFWASAPEDETYSSAMETYLMKFEQQKANKAVEDNLAR